MTKTPPPLPPRVSTLARHDPSRPSKAAPRAGAATALIAAVAVGIILLVATLVLSLALASLAMRDEDASSDGRRSPEERSPDQGSDDSTETASRAEGASSADEDGGSEWATEEATGADADLPDVDSVAGEAAGGAAGDSQAPLPGDGSASSSASGPAGAASASSFESGASSRGEEEPPPPAAPLRPGRAFGIDAVGDKVVYVVDCSTELGRQGYATATDGVVASLRSLGSDQEFAVVLFADDVYPMCFPDLKEETLLPSTAARTRVETWLAEFDREALERSRAAPALEYALSLEPTDLFFVSGSTPDQETVDAITDQNGGTAIVHTIGVDVASTETLRSLAQRNGGLFREAP